ncbi:hypothetical protein DWG18_10355 [Lysobacter sp. TY2-98]|uniref:hypothetical protein n=1 Tax=Lysobacter sp. TY2-98 TaxID=2290922 RepID=UPI000E20AABB|nr:hypothetical protein [Lysobacter sp. TY2-98]AXK72631.1 hypothetical protein DWG18_10355 [Lysobacter sp. TY2-98]
MVEIAQRLVSDEDKPGATFAIRLAEPIVVNGFELVPAGTPGQGEIIHAAKARGGGQPGELLLAARYLEFNGHRIPLRGLKLGAAGKDHTGAALATAVAVGVFAEFIHGGEMIVESGTRAPAKLAGAIDAALLASPASESTAAAASPTAASAAPSTQE